MASAAELITASAGETLKRLYCLKDNNPDISLQIGEFYSVEVIHKKGLGLVAAKDLVRGCKIIVEDYSIKFATETVKRALASLSFETIEASIERRIQTLPREAQKVFYSLHNARDARAPNLGRLLTNGLQLNEHEMAVFPTLARVNHSCYPNAHFSWNPLTMRGSLFCIRKTFKGEELTISYCQNMPSYLRQNKLKEEYGFLCQCEICNLKTHDLNASNKRQIHILHLAPRITDFDRLREHPGLALKDVYDLMKMYEGEDITDVRLAVCLRRAFDIHVAHGDLARARFFGERMYQETIVCNGLGHPMTVKMEDMMVRPQNTSLYLLSEKWKLAREAEPDLLEGEINFEQWLWMRTGVNDPQSFPPAHIDYIP